MIAALASLAAGCADGDEALLAKSRRVFGTIEEARGDAPPRPELVRLGQILYVSPELSVNGTQSCSSCHPVAGGAPGVDGLPTSPGALGAPGRRNTPTVLNASLQFAQFWDGRAESLETQAAGPILNPLEMGMPTEAAVERRLRSMDPALFRAAFPGEENPFTLDHAARALAAFQRTLLTSDRFDDFQRGDAGALSATEKRGLEAFLDAGCASCHGGPLLGGAQFQKVGIVHPWTNEADRGRYEVTSDEIDQFVFKVPSLRNVALTPPYFHDGTVETLEKAVDRMAWHQLGKKLPPEERDAIVAFLRALSDEDRVAARAE
ncbi:MAG: cytochrome-c peroxidase [Thermoanaerobaculia bacterium]